MDGGAIIKRKDIETLEWADFNPQTPLYKSLISAFSFNNSYYADFDWIERQIQYVYSLSQGEKDILYFYTLYGDEFANSFLRLNLKGNRLKILLRKIEGNEDFIKRVFNTENSLNEMNIVEKIETYTRQLSDIIERAPRLTKPIQLFRGVKNMQHYTTNPFVEKGFLSTTLYLPSSIQFMGDNCCLQEIILNPENACLFIAPMSRKPGEFEVLCNKNRTVSIVKKYGKSKYIVDVPDFHKTNDVFFNPHRYPSMEKRTVYSCVI